MKDIIFHKRIVRPAVHAVNRAVAALQQERPGAPLVHLSNTGQPHYRHDPVGQGRVPFAGIPAMLVYVGYCERSMLEIISRQPDRDILDSAARLAAMASRRR